MKDNYPTAGLQETGAIERLKEKADNQKIEGVVPIAKPDLWVDLELSDVRKAIEEIRTKNDLIAVMNGKDSRHLLVGDIKKIGIWGLIGLLISIVKKYFLK